MVEIRNLEFSYGCFKVLDNVSLTLADGKIYGLLGENGVGKTTLLKILSGLIKVNKGECFVDSRIPFDREPDFLQDIFFLPEDFAGPDISIELYAKQLGVFYPNFSAEKFYRIIKEFGVDYRAHFTRLSSGQQKKAILAVALSIQPKLLLLDEPSNGLDIPSKSLLRRMILENSTENQIILISTHQVRDLENLIDPIIIMDRDGVILNASVEEIASRLAFSIEQSIDDTALYSFKDLRGYTTIRVNDSHIETPVDLESLFNCAYENKDKIKRLFNEKRF